MHRCVKTITTVLEGRCAVFLEALPLQHFRFRNWLTDAAGVKILR